MNVHFIFRIFSVEINKCSGSCCNNVRNISDPFEKLCVPDVAKNINVKVFNLMSRSNETRHIESHETCKCILDASVCNNKQCWNNEKCKCKCKELVRKDRCEKGFIWYPSNCDCECDKSCDVSE